MKNYFFILSFSRSGSTTLGQKINNHSDVHVVNESWMFSLLGTLKWREITPLRQKYIFNQIEKEAENNNSNKINSDSAKSVAVSVKDLFETITQSDANFLGEKTPANLFYYNYIKRRFKDAKFIFLKRHPLAICASYYSRWYSSSYNDKFIIETVNVIKAYNERFDSIKNKEEILQVKYEDLVRESKTWMTKIAQHIGFEFEEKMLAESEEKLFTNSESEIHHQESHKSLNDFHVDKYKSVFTPHQLQELSYLLRYEIKRLGYPQDELIIPNERLKRLEKKISQKRSPKRINRRKKITLLKAKLSYLKFILKHVLG
jgi:hypothetical protein